MAYKTSARLRERAGEPPPQAGRRPTWNHSRCR